MPSPYRSPYSYGQTPGAGIAQTLAAALEGFTEQSRERQRQKAQREMEEQRRAHEEALIELRSEKEKELIGPKHEARLSEIEARLTRQESPEQKFMRELAVKGAGLAKTETPEERRARELAVARLRAEEASKTKAAGSEQREQQEWVRGLTAARQLHEKMPAFAEPEERANWLRGVLGSAISATPDTNPFAQGFKQSLQRLDVADITQLDAYVKKMSVEPGYEDLVEYAKARIETLKRQAEAKEPGFLSGKPGWIF